MMDLESFHQGWFWQVLISVAGGLVAGYGTVRTWIEGLHVRVTELERRANVHEDLLTQEIRLLREEIGQMRLMFVNYLHSKAN